MQLDEVFRRQFGVISRHQATAAGLSERQVDYRLATGRWTRIHPGVYKLRAVASSWHGSVLAAVLASDGLGSHRCGAALWGLEVYTNPRPEIAVPVDRRARLDGVIVHRTTQWDRCEPTTRLGIPCTGIERTLLDCAAVAGLRRTERLAEAAIRRRLTSWPLIATCLQRHSRRGRDGCGTLRALLEMRLGDETIPLSDFSRLIVNLLDEHGLPPPIVEHAIVDRHGDHILQVDLAWPARRKAWELDGLRYHFGRTDVERDRRKRNRAITEGWTIQEILWSMYTDEPDELVAMARRFLA